MGKKGYSRISFFDTRQRMQFYIVQLLRVVLALQKSAEADSGKSIKVTFVDAP